jgi:hypothetical protein
MYIEIHTFSKSRGGGKEGYILKSQCTLRYIEILPLVKSEMSVIGTQSPPPLREMLMYAVSHSTTCIRFIYRYAVKCRLDFYF